MSKVEHVTSNTTKYQPDECLPTDLYDVLVAVEVTNIFLEGLTLYMERAGISTQAELAQKLGVKAPAINPWFKHKRLPSDEMLHRLPEVLNLDAKEADFLVQLHGFQQQLYWWATRIRSEKDYDKLRKDIGIVSNRLDSITAIFDEFVNAA